MNPSLPPSLAGFHIQQHTQDHTQQSPVSDADFLARVSAFERNEEAEARRARETMRRMISDQANSKRRHNPGCGGPKRRDRSPPAGASTANVGIFREFPCHFQGPVPTKSQPPPQPPVAGFNIYGRHLNTTASASVYPFYEISTSGPPPLQDPYHDALVLVSSPFHLAAPAPAHAPPFTSHPARLSDPAPFPGSAVPTRRIMPPQYYPNPHDLTRDTHDRDRGRERRARHSHSHDHQERSWQETQDVTTNHYTHRGDHNAVWSYPSPALNPHGTATPAPPPRISSHLAPPTSPASLGFHQSHKNTTKEPTYTEPPPKKREPSFRIDYDLRTHPATLRVSPSSSTLLSKPACTPKEQVNIRLATPRVASRA